MSPQGSIFPYCCHLVWWCITIQDCCGTQQYLHKHWIHDVKKIHGNHSCVLSIQLQLYLHSLVFIHLSGIFCYGTVHLAVHWPVCPYVSLSIYPSRDTYFCAMSQKVYSCQLELGIELFQRLPMMLEEMLDLIHTNSRIQNFWSRPEGRILQRSLISKYIYWYDDR